MIKYSLICKKDHEFEGWFASSDDFEKQKKRGLLECPTCGSSKISKSLMAPRLSGTAKSTDVESSELQTMPTPAMPQEVVNKLREIKQYVEKNAENVGDKFPEEARKIHYGEAQERGIYGKASKEEVSSLVDEGVNLVPLPDLPEEKN